MKNLIFCLLSIVLLLPHGAHSNIKPHEETIRSIADNILMQPVGLFVGVTNKQIYSSTKEIPKGEDVKFNSPLTEWHYSNGVLDMSMMRLGKYLNEPKYIEYAKKHIEFGFNNYEYFKKNFRYDRNHWHWPFGQLWNFKELDDCGAMGAAIVHLYELYPQETYKQYIENTAKHILRNQTRLADGTLCRTFPQEMTVWADDVYMSVSFLSQAGRLTGDTQYFDEAAKQILQIADYLWCNEQKLFYHCYYTSKQRNGVAFWGRANGWIIVSLAMLLAELPEDHSKRTDLIKLLEKQIVGFSRYQNANGMWYQLLNKPDSYQESSVTAMFVYGVAKAINHKWIDNSYGQIAEAGWKALEETQITSEGLFKNVCVGTGISDDLPFYYNRPVGENEKHGLGLIIETGIEMMIFTENKKK